MALKLYLKGATLILVFPPVQLLVFPAAVEGLVASCTALIGLKVGKFIRQELFL